MKIHSSPWFKNRILIQLVSLRCLVIGMSRSRKLSLEYWKTYKSLSFKLCELVLVLKINQSNLILLLHCMLHLWCKLHFFSLLFCCHLSECDAHLVTAHICTLYLLSLMITYYWFFSFYLYITWANALYSVKIKNWIEYARANIHWPWCIWRICDHPC